MIRFSAWGAYLLSATSKEGAYSRQGDYSGQGAYSRQGAYSGQGAYFIFWEPTKCSKQYFNKY